MPWISTWLHVIWLFSALRCQKKVIIMATVEVFKLYHIHFYPVEQRGPVNPGVFLNSILSWNWEYITDSKLSMYSSILTAFKYYKGGGGQLSAIDGNRKDDSTPRCVSGRRHPHRSGSAISKSHCWHSVKSDADFIHVNYRSSGNSDWQFGGVYAENRLQRTWETRVAGHLIMFSGFRHPETLYNIKEMLPVNS